MANGTETRKLPSGRMVTLRVLKPNEVMATAIAAADKVLRKGGDNVSMVEVSQSEKEALKKACLVGLEGCDPHDMPETIYEELSKHPMAQKDWAIVGLWYDRRHGLSELEEAAFFDETPEK